MVKGGFVYILARRRNGTLYIGVTSNLPRRMYEHQNGLIKGFTWHYGVSKLVYYEEYGTIVEAIAREKAMKKWYRAWKLKTIEAFNPEWHDLTEI